MVLNKSDLRTLPRKALRGNSSYFHFFLLDHLLAIKTFYFSLPFRGMKLQLSVMLKSKASLLEREAWGYFTASLAGTKTYGLWDILEYLFDESPETEEEEGPPCRKIHLEDEPSTSSDPSDSKPPTIPSSKIEIAFPINEGSLHDSGISQEFLPICEQLSQFIFVVLIVDIMLRADPHFVHTLAKHI